MLKIRKMAYAIAITALLAATPVIADEAKEQVGEAAALFAGEIAPATRSGAWKVVYSSAEGSQKRALEILTERIGAHLLRDGHTATSLVLPLEKEGGAPVAGKRDAIVVGMPSGFATHCQAELFWSSEDGWEEIANRARMRARPER